MLSEKMSWCSVDELKLNDVSVLSSAEQVKASQSVLLAAGRSQQEKLYQLSDVRPFWLVK
jgi:hypothetical protein